MENNGNLTIQDVINITGKAHTTIYRYVRSGKLKTVTVAEHGRTCYRVLKSDLEQFLGHSIEHPAEHDMPLVEHGMPLKEHVKTVAEHGMPLTKNNLKETFQEFLEEQKAQLMKPLEEHALVRYGAISKENEFLRQRLELLVEENSRLQEQVKVLPGPSEVENLQSQIQTLRKEKEQSLKEQETRLKAESEEQMKQLAEAWKKELEQARRPWWKFW